MIQWFSLRSPLIQGHGNFGSIDADPPAGMKYTECRLNIDFVPNFDNSKREPSVLPARIPNLLLNGASGIAVGMATAIPPHNLGELVDALVFLIHNPEATLQELLEHMPGPDFPTGGIIMGNIGILEAYKTGRGCITIRGKIDIETLDPKTKRTAIIIKEIPYQTNKASLVKKIVKLMERKRLEGISDIRDESDGSGTRVVIELKRGSDSTFVLNNLYRHTALQSTFCCNMVGILDGQPKLMDLKEILQAFLDFRCSIVERRARFKLSQAQERNHIVQGIIIVLDNLDMVIDIIRNASTNEQATANLMKEFELSEKQVDAILDIRLRSLTALERDKIVAKGKSLTEQIFNLQVLVSSRKNTLQIIEEEAIQIKNKFSSPRRSILEETGRDIIPNDETIMAITEKGYVKRMRPDTFNLRNHDDISRFFVCYAHDQILYFSNKGIVYSAPAYKIPKCSQDATGTPFVQIFSLSNGERITSIVPMDESTEDQNFVMGTEKGYNKKMCLNSSSIRSTSRITAIQLVPGDELKWVWRCTNDDDLAAMAS